MPDPTMRVDVPGKGIIEFPAGTSDADIEEAIKQLDAEPAADSKTKPAAPRGVLATMGREALDWQTGLAKEAGQFVTNIARVPHMVPGFTSVVDRVYGEPGASMKALDAADAFLAPSNTTQKVAKTAAQIAETVVPGGMISKAGTALAARAPAGVRLLTRMAVEGAGGAAMAGVQRTDPTSAGVVSGLLPAGGAALSKVGRAFRSSNPVIQESIDLAKRRGIPIDAATATDHGLVRATQHIADRSLGGSFISHGARDAQAGAMQRVAKELASEAHPEAIGPLEAGRALQEGVKAKVREFYQEANAAYGALRDIVARPENLRQVPRGVTDTVDVVAPAVDDVAMFRPTSKRPGDLWAAVQQDAKNNGYKGTTKDLREAFDQKMTAANALVDEMGDGNEGRNFLKFIADNGGIGIPEKDLSGEVKRLREMVITPGGKYRSGGALGGVTGVVRPQAGLTVDKMVERIRASGQFGPWEDMPDSALFEAIEDAVRMTDSITVTPLEALAQTGVRPGQTWWKAAEEAVPVFDEMALPVDMRPIKESLRPLHDDIQRNMSVFKRQNSEGVLALDNVMNGPDYSPAMIANDDLSAIKKIARGATMPEGKTRSQGLASTVVGRFEDAVQKAIAEAGPDATAARDTGRAYTREKYAALKILKAIKGEPREAFNQAVSSNDTGMNVRQAIADLAPEQMPKVGRAFLESLFEKATAEGGFGRAAGLARSWENLGAETKKLIYPNPMLRRDLDAFFHLAKKAAENPNPSGTWHMAVQGGQWVYLATNPQTGVPLQIGAALLSKLLHSPKGVRLLSEGLKPGTMARYSTAGTLFAQLKAAAMAPAALPVSREESRTGAAR